MDTSVSDHLRTDGTNGPPGTYRVVGTDGRRVTLLRVGDGEGRRVHTGEVVRVTRDDLDGFVPVEAPTAERSPTDPVSIVYWSLRAFLAELAARPLASVVALGLVVAGSVGPVSSPLANGLLFGGAGLLWYVGSGRLRG